MKTSLGSITLLSTAYTATSEVGYASLTSFAALTLYV
jgi:hypothetical protein